MGQTVARYLAADDLISHIIIAGRNLGMAERFAAELAPQATAVQVDATDEERLSSIAADCDIVVNTAGPDFEVPQGVRVCRLILWQRRRQRGSR